MIGQIAAALTVPVRVVGRTIAATGRTVARVPSVFDAILTLPSLTEQLEAVRVQTATLIDMEGEIAQVRGDTASLPPILETLERVAMLLERVDGNTAAVEQLAEVMLPLQDAAERVGRMTDRWPRRRGLRAPGAAEG